MPEKTTYYAGDAFDVTGLKVSACYSNGMIGQIEDYQLSIEAGTVLNVHGEQKVTVSYNGFKTDFSITVLKKVISLTIVSFPEKLAYYVGEAIDYSGLKVTAQYSDESEVAIEDYTLSLAQGTILTNAQTYTISVSYEGCSKDFAVEVESNKVSVISVTLPEHQDVENLLTYADGLFTAKSDFSSYTWWVDSTKLSIYTKTYRLVTANLSDGYHSVMVVVQNSAGEKYSATATVHITREER